MLNKFSLKLIVFILILTVSSCASRQLLYHLNDNGIRVKTGLENFIDCCASDYRGKKALLATNHSGVDRNLEQNITLLRSKGIIIDRVLAPEHGLYGNQNDYDINTHLEDKKFGVRVFNLHKLNSESLVWLIKESDLVIFDIQDMGMRCYTYISNLKFIIDSMRGTGKELIVLDRPNPISFLKTDGAYLEEKFYSRFVSAFPATFIYNMTMGESAKYYHKESGSDVKLRIIKMKGFASGMKYSDTGLPWVPPSPNLPTFESSIVYTAVVLLEGINFSIGRGTPKPFEYIGAPWIDPVKLHQEMESLKLRNFKFKPVYFSPTFSKFRGELCGGVQIFYTGGVFSPTDVAYKILQTLLKNYPQVRWEKYQDTYAIDNLTGTDRFRINIDAGKKYSDYYSEIRGGIVKFERKRRKIEIY